MKILQYCVNYTQTRGNTEQELLSLSHTVTALGVIGALCYTNIFDKYSFSGLLLTLIWLNMQLNNYTTRIHSLITSRQSLKAVPFFRDTMD